MPTPKLEPEASAGVAPSPEENPLHARFAEFLSTGPGARPMERVPWSKQLTPLEASAITPQHVLGGWDPRTALSAERVASLPGGEREAWEEYLERSARYLREEQSALAAEVREHNLPAQLTAPSGPDFKLPSKPTREWFASPEAAQLALVVRSFQTPTGGWSKHVNYEKGVRRPAMHWSSQGDAENAWHYVGTFDNRSTTEQLRLLAGVFEATQRAEEGAAFFKGIDYILAAQMPNGGWPQVYPLEGGYHDNITFNDDAMVHILALLQDIATRTPGCTFVDEDRRARASAALDHGVRCILSAQVVQDGRRTVWCAQHEPLTLAIAPARFVEPASLSGGESVALVQFLMKLRKPSPEVTQAIEDALVWFERTKITGFRRTKKEGRTVYEADPSSSEIYWARFYDAATNRPIFPGSKDGRIYSSYDEMAAANRVGYDFYLTKPAELLTKVAARWRAQRLE